VLDLADFIARTARECGFDLAGVSPLSHFPELDYFPKWIAEGRGGEMRYLESRNDQGELKRCSVPQVFPWAQSVIVCAMNYNSGESSTATGTTGEGAGATTKSGHGWISRYAWSQRDYHDVLLERLRRLEARVKNAAGSIQTRCYVDTGPLIERIYARYAGIGWIGKNTCVINQQIGSWLFLGVILTSLPLSGTVSAENRESRIAGRAAPISAFSLAPDRCGSCTRCLDACPTNAFLGPYRLDASRCISYLTIEHRGEIPEILSAGMGRHVFGCDICQDVCPWNRKAPATALADFQPREKLVNPDLKWLANISEQDFRQSFRGSPVKRAKRSGLRRNAVIAMGNSGDSECLPLLRELAHDPDAIVARHAHRAIEKLVHVAPGKNA
jgi:epoxyqueuosine reductase